MSIRTVLLLASLVGGVAATPQQSPKPEATSLLGKPLVPAPITPEARKTLEQNPKQAEIVYRRNPDDPEATIWLVTPESLLAPGNRGLDAVTTRYGIAAWHLASGRKEPGLALLREVVANYAQQWPAFGYVAAEADLARLGRAGG